MKTKIIFVRHGEAEGNVYRRFHGQYNSNLTENGYKQIEKTADFLKNEHIDVLYSSDLTRTIETAKPIAKTHNLSIIQDSTLREIDGGDWEDVEWEELPVSFAESYGHWLEKPHLLKMPNGESMVNFQRRLINAVENIVSKHEGQTICIVTHGTAIKSLVCFYYGKTLEEFPLLKWHDNASVTIVEKDGDIYSVIEEGINAHLGDLSTLAHQSWWKK